MEWKSRKSTEKRLKPNCRFFKPNMKTSAKKRQKPAKSIVFSRKYKQFAKHFEIELS